MDTVTSANGITYQVTTSDTLTITRGDDDANKVVREYQTKVFTNVATGDTVTATAELTKTYISGICEVATMRCWHVSNGHAMEYVNWRIQNYCIERTMGGVTKAWTRYAVPSTYKIADAYYGLPKPKKVYWTGKRKAKQHA